MPADGTSWTIHADKVYTSTGKVHESALIVVEGGKIRAITPGVEATRDALKAAVVTAGMIDASARLNSGTTSVEQSSEVTPLVSAEFGVDLFSPGWGRLARKGVTSAFITPLNQNCIGGMGTVLKTAGDRSVKGRTVEGAPMICGAIGSQPSQRNSSAFGRPTSFFNRRPTTRMGVEWEWRKSPLSRLPRRRSRTRLRRCSSTRSPGKVGVFVQAWATQDIRTRRFPQGGDGARGLR